MSSIISKISLACLFLFLASRARADEARTVLERAIRAHGGADKLERTKRGRLKANAEGNLGLGGFMVTLEETFDLPGRYRRTVVGVAGGTFCDMEYAIQGTRGWIRQGRNPPQDFPVAEPLSLERHWHAILAQLLLLRSKDTELKFLGEKVKDERRLIGISAHSPQAAGDLYFDRTTGLLARAVRPVPNVALGKATEGEVGENIFDDYKEIQGVQYPMHSKATSRGVSLEVKIASIEFLDKIDDDLFAKPAVSPPPEPPTLPDEPPEERPKDESPARWDMRFLVATLAVGSVVAVVWLIVRGSKGRKQEAPSQ